jgi:prolyl-tRNA synthetase
MTHGDDDGLIIPPRVAPSHIAILPITHKEETKAEVHEYCEKLAHELQSISYDGRPLKVEFDKREIPGGEKVWSWIKKGIPMWVEIGPRDVQSNSVFVGHRDQGKSGCKSMPYNDFVSTISDQLNDIQDNLYKRAFDFSNRHTQEIDSKDDFYSYFTPENKSKPEIHGGFASCHFCEDRELEKQISDDLNVTIRCIPIEGDKQQGTCIFTGKPSNQRVIFAKAY